MEREWWWGKALWVRKREKTGMRFTWDRQSVRPYIELSVKPLWCKLFPSGVSTGGDQGLYIGQTKLLLHSHYRRVITGECCNFLKWDQIQARRGCEAAGEVTSGSLLKFLFLHLWCENTLKVLSGRYFKFSVADAASDRRKEEEAEAFQFPLIFRGKIQSRANRYYSTVA